MKRFILLLVSVLMGVSVLALPFVSVSAGMSNVEIVTDASFDGEIMSNRWYYSGGVEYGDHSAVFGDGSSESSRLIARRRIDDVGKYGRESDTAEWTDFEKDLYSFRTLTPVPSEYYYLRSPVFSAGGADAYAGIDIIGKLSAHEGDSMTASQIWEQMMQTFSANWSTYLENAGIAQ